VLQQQASGDGTFGHADQSFQPEAVPPLVRDPTAQIQDIRRLAVARDGGSGARTMAAQLLPK
jgi:hypothetical protein